jgi:hypothetical protein
MLLTSKSENKFQQSPPFFRGGGVGHKKDIYFLI